MQGFEESDYESGLAGQIESLINKNKLKKYMTKFGFHDFTASEKPPGFSLFWRGRIVDEEHYEPHLSEYSGISTNLEEIYERAVPTRGQTGPDVNAPLVPLLPHIKRNKDNHLAMFLEGDTLHNKTIITREGIAGARFGEGVDSGTRMLKRWAESQKTKC